MSELQNITEQISLLTYSEMNTLVRHLRERIKDEELMSVSESQKKLDKFERAVRKAGFKKALNKKKVTKNIEVTAELDWSGDIRGLGEPSEVYVDVFAKAKEVDSAFKAEAKEYKRLVLSEFKKLKKMVKEHGVEDLNWEKAVSFLWE